MKNHEHSSIQCVSKTASHIKAVDVLEENQTHYAFTLRAAKGNQLFPESTDIL